MGQKNWRVLANFSSDTITFNVSVLYDYVGAMERNLYSDQEV